MDLPGIPDSIPIGRVRELLTALGVPIDQVTADGIHIGWNSIECTVFALTPDGKRYLESATDEVATHRISIFVDHAEDQ